MHTTLYRQLVILLCLAAAQTAVAQDYACLHFSTRNGLAGDNVYGIAQDKDGFIWISTETGVSRFDGTSFKNYMVKDGLPSNDVTDVVIDRRNRVWVSPFKREICYIRNGIVHNRQNDPLIRQIPISSEAKYLATDNAGCLLIESDKHIVYIDSNDIPHIFHTPYNGKPFFKPVHIIGHLSIGIVDTPAANYQKWYSYHYVYYQPYRLTARRSIMYDKDGLLTIFEDKKPLYIFPAPANTISIHPYNDSVILLHRQNGCYTYNINTRRIVAPVLQHVTGHISFTDAESGIWLGTGGEGLFYIPSARNRSITRTPDNSPLQIYHFYTNGDQLIAGLNNWQFWEIDQQNFTLKRKLTPGEINAQLLCQPPGNMQKFPGNGALEVLARKQQVVYTGSFDKSLTNNGDTLMTVSARGCILRFLPHKKIEETTWDGRLTCGSYHNGQYYMGTLEGLYTFKKKGTTYSPQNSNLLLAANISAIVYSYKTGIMWVATPDDGVYCLERDKVTRHFNEANGLAGNSCTCIYTDGSSVYVGTLNGLSIIHPDNGFRIANYYVADGLGANNIRCVYGSGNKVWAGTSEGLSYLELPDTPTAFYCKLNITEIMVSGKKLSPDTNMLTLLPQDNNIRFSWSGISFQSMDKIRYTYRLRGLSDAWQTTDQDYLSYPSLPSGSYAFDIYASNRYQTKSAIQTIEFTIRKRWWAHWWVQLSGVLILCASLLLLMWRRSRKVQQRQKEQIALREKIIELEQLALRAQMNPHFIFNSLNSFYQYVITKDLAGASKFMSEFSRLIRLLFETTSLTEITLDRELDFLHAYTELEMTKLNNVFSGHFSLEEGLHTSEIVIPSFIIQPFIENSIRHGIQNRQDNAGRIDISLVTRQSDLIVTIEDNGPGREYTSAMKSRHIAIGQSKGIALTEERIALYNKTHHTNVRFSITDNYENGKATGTTVTIHFPQKTPL